jgi:hypothetical protein
MPANPEPVVCCAECNAIGCLNPSGVGILWDYSGQFEAKDIIAYIHCDRCQIADETPEVLRILSRIPEC